jgi:hypothetical protein
MKKIIYFLVLSLFVFSCSKSDDDNSPESCNTFLECNDGSTWILDYDFAVVLFRINDNINNLLEQWVIYDSEDCYYYLGNTYVLYYTITENTKDKLVLKIDDASTTSTLTFSIVNGELKLIVQEIFDGELSYEDTLVLQETTIDVDNLTICT